MIKNLCYSFLVIFKYARISAVVKLLIMLILGIIAPMNLLLIRILIDNVTAFMGGKGKISDSILVCVLLLIVMLVQATDDNINNIIDIKMQRQLNKNMTPILLRKFTMVKYQYFEDSDTQDTIKCMSDNPQGNIMKLFLDSTNLLSITISLLGSVLLFAQARWWYVLGFLLLLIPILWCDYKATEIMNDMIEKQSRDQRKMDYLGSLIMEKDSSFELKLFNAVPYIINLWTQKAKIVLNERTRKIVKANSYYFFSIPLSKLWMIFIIYDLIVMTSNSFLSIGVFSTLIMSLGTVLNNSDALSHGFQNVAQKSLLMKFYKKFMLLPEVEYNNVKFTGNQLTIKFENVDFTYPKTNKKILTDVCFEIKPNEKVALVGENGAGKSTIIKLICGLYRPDKGKILVNGVNLNDYSPDQFCKMFSVLFQDYGKYWVSLRENIAFGNIDEIDNDQKIYDVLKNSYGEEINDNLNISLGKLNEDGVDLSGGQWQRVALARSNYSNACFRILDEPTSALDPIVESKLYQNFSNMVKNRACLIVSHRLPSAKMADKILVLKEGRIIEQGTHKQLLDQKGVYEYMWKTQSYWYKGDLINETD